MCVHILIKNFTPKLRATSSARPPQAQRANDMPLRRRDELHTGEISVRRRFQDEMLPRAVPVTALNLSTAISYESLKSSTAEPTSSSSLNLNVIQPL
jgi:hypothetical protein